MELLFATGNPAKLATMGETLRPLGIKLIGLNDLSGQIPEVTESAPTSLGNATIKAKAYYAAFKRPLFSCDSSLYIEGLSESEQPGANVRLVNGRWLDDDETTAHYSALIKRLGGRTTAHYRNAVCLILGEDKIYAHDGDDIMSGPFIMVSEPHEKATRGFPLDRLSINMKTGKYYNDLKAGEEVEYGWGEGYRNFFRRALGL